MMPTADVMLYIFVAGVAATAIWRFAGLLLSSGLAEDSQLIAWFRAVSTALVAGLVAKLILFPPGALAEIGVAARIGAFGLGVLCFVLGRQHLGLGMLAGVGALVAARLLGA